MKKFNCKKIFLCVTLLVILVSNITAIFSYESKKSEDWIISQKIDGLYQALRTCDVDSILKNVNIGENKESKYIKEYFDTYKDSKDAVSNYFKLLKYEIVSIDKVNDKYKVKLKITALDINELIKKIYPKFLLKYGIKIITKKFKMDNLILNDILNMINQELDENAKFKDTSIILYFARSGDDFILDANQLVNELSKYINNFANLN